MEYGLANHFVGGSDQNTTYYANTIDNPSKYKKPNNKRKKCKKLHKARKKL